MEMINNELNVDRDFVEFMVGLGFRRFLKHIEIFNGKIAKLKMTARFFLYHPKN